MRGPGTVPYLRALLASLHRYRASPAIVSLDAEVLTCGPVAAVVVANGAHYGGGMRISPGSDPADGRLDAVVVGNLGRLELLCWLPAVYRGTHLANAKVRTRSGREIRLEVPPSTAAQLDGECLADPPARVIVAPQALLLRR